MRLLPLLLLLAAPALADQLAVSPPISAVELRAYGFGLLSLDGKFTRFHGSIRYDPAQPALCQVVVEVEGSSLVMATQSIRDQMTGPTFMDVVRFPTFAFQGNCQGDTLAGSLTLHGETHPLTLELVRSGQGIIATGKLRRGDWGMKTPSMIAGSTIRIRVETPNPFVASRPLPGSRD